MLRSGYACHVCSRLPDLASCPQTAQCQAWKATLPHSTWQHAHMNLRGIACSHEHERHCMLGPVLYRQCPLLLLCNRVVQALPMPCNLMLPP